MNSFVRTRTDLPEIALFWNNALSRRNFRHSLGRQRLALYFMPFKVSVFLGNEGKGWERDVFNQTDFTVVRISSRKMHKNGQNRKYYILFISNGNRKNKGILSPDHVHEKRLSSKKVFIAKNLLSDECLKIAQVNLGDHSWQISHQDRSFHKLKYSLCVFLEVYLVSCMHTC